MMITGRQAAALLRDVLSSDEHARLALRAGLAGRGVETSRGTFYDADSVDALRLRPGVVARELAAACAHGVLVARLPRTVALDVTVSWAELARQVAGAIAGQRPMTPLSVALTGVQIRAWGPLPLVATLLGYVVLAAEVTRLGPREPRLAPPGPWAGVVEGRRFPTPPGGRPLSLWSPPADAHVEPGK